MRKLRNLFTAITLTLCMILVPTSTVNAGIVENELGKYCVDENRGEIVTSQWIFDIWENWRFAMPDGTFATNVTLEIGEASHYFDMTTNQYLEGPIPAGVYEFDEYGMNISDIGSPHEEESYYDYEEEQSTSSSNVLTEAELAAIASQYLPYYVNNATYAYSLNMGLGFYVYFNTDYGLCEVKLLRDLMGMVLFGGSPNNFTCESVMFM